MCLEVLAVLISKFAKRGGPFLPVLLLFPQLASAACSPTEKSTAEQHYNTAYQFVTAREWQPAVEPLEKALVACPEHWASLELLAQARLQLKHNSTSAQLYKKLVDGQYGGSLAAADGNRVLRPYGFALLRSKNWSEAEIVYNTLLSQDPRDPEAHQRLVYIFENTDRSQRAVEILEQQYNFTMDEAEQSKLAQQLGDAYTKMGANTKAKQWFAISGDGGGSSMFKIGVDQMNKKEYAAAATSFVEYLKGNPASVPALKNLGLCYDQLGRQSGGAKHKSDAIAAYEQVVALEPDRHDVQSSLAFLYLDTGALSKAASIGQAAVDGWDNNDDKKGGMYFLMGKVLEKRDSAYEQAIKMFELALSDSFWGSRAEKEIERQQQLIQIREMRDKQGG
jgi:tetratricopeptide (TPR) repeat protein